MSGPARHNSGFARLLRWFGCCRLLSARPRPCAARTCRPWRAAQPRRAEMNQNVVRSPILRSRPEPARPGARQQGACSMVRADSHIGAYVRVGRRRRRIESTPTICRSGIRIRRHAVSAQGERRAQPRRATPFSPRRSRTIAPHDRVAPVAARSIRVPHPTLTRGCGGAEESCVPFRRRPNLS